MGDFVGHRRGKSSPKEFPIFSKGFFAGLKIELSPTSKQGFCGAENFVGSIEDTTA
jgi:hypothetical protein